jgi:hypothetical protein
MPRKAKANKATKRAPKQSDAPAEATPPAAQAPEVKDELNKIAETAREIANLSGTGPAPAVSRDPSEPAVPQPPQVLARLEAEEKNEKPPVHEKAHKEPTVTAEDKQWIKEREEARERTKAPEPVHWKDLPGAEKGPAVTKAGITDPSHNKSGGKAKKK